MTHSPSSAQSELSDERINELALLNLGYDRAIRPLDFARAIEREVRAAASAQATTQTEIIRALQKALFYWMPRCAGEDSPWGTKAAEHAYLLIGLDDNSTECWGDQMLEYVGIMNRQQERLEIVLRDAGCEDEADHIEFIQKLADRAAASEHTDFEWPPLPAFHKPFLDSEKSGAVFTEHQMQAYANAYGEAVRRLATPPSPDAREAGGGVNGHDIEKLFLTWSEWTTELGEAISRKNIDGFVSDLFALSKDQTK